MTAALYSLGLGAFAVGLVFGLLVGQRLQIRSCERQGHNR